MRLVAGVLVKEHNKYLLVQEKIPAVYGSWNLPAGHVDENESLKEAAQREAKEETGLDINVGEEVLVMNDDFAEIHIFEGKVLGGKVVFNSDELLNVSWFSADEIKGLQLREPLFLKLFL